MQRYFVPHRGTRRHRGRAGRVRTRASNGWVKVKGGHFPSKGTPEMSEVLPVQSPLIAGATPLLPPGEARVRD